MKCVPVAKGISTNFSVRCAKQPSSEGAVFFLGGCKRCRVTDAVGAVFRGAQEPGGRGTARGGEQVSVSVASHLPCSTEYVPRTIPVTWRAKVRRQ